MANYNIELNYFDGNNYNVLYPKISWSNNSGGTISSSYIPNLDMSKITTGNLAASRITGLSTINLEKEYQVYSGTGSGTASVNFTGKVLVAVWEDQGVGSIPQTYPAMTSKRWSNGFFNYQ